jgi:cytochrome c1
MEIINMVTLRKKINLKFSIVLGLPVLLLLLLLLSTGCSSKNLTQSQQNGYQAFKSYCFSCHNANGEGLETGIDLSKVGFSRDESWLRSFLEKPKSVNPNANMPVLNLSGQQRDDISDYLTTLK